MYFLKTNEQTQNQNETKNPHQQQQNTQKTQTNQPINQPANQPNQKLISAQSQQFFRNLEVMKQTGQDSKKIWEKMMHHLERLALVVFSLCRVFEFTLHMACQEKKHRQRESFRKSMRNIFTVRQWACRFCFRGVHVFKRLHAQLLRCPWPEFLSAKMWPVSWNYPGS